MLNQSQSKHNLIFCNLFDSCHHTILTNPFQFGVKGDVALRRVPNGALSAQAKYFQAKEFRVGDVKLDKYIQSILQSMLGGATLEKYIEQTVRKSKLMEYYFRAP